VSNRKVLLILLADSTVGFPGGDLVGPLDGEGRCQVPQVGGGLPAGAQVLGEVHTLLLYCRVAQPIVLTHDPTIFRLLARIDSGHPY